MDEFVSEDFLFHELQEIEDFIRDLQTTLRECPVPKSSKLKSIVLGVTIPVGVVTAAVAAAYMNRKKLAKLKTILTKARQLEELRPTEEGKRTVSELEQKIAQTEEEVHEEEEAVKLKKAEDVAEQKGKEKEEEETERKQAEEEEAKQKEEAEEAAERKEEEDEATRKEEAEEAAEQKPAEEEEAKQKEEAEEAAERKEEEDEAKRKKEAAEQKQAEEEEAKRKEEAAEQKQAEEDEAKRKEAAERKEEEEEAERKQAEEEEAKRKQEEEEEAQWAAEVAAEAAEALVVTQKREEKQNKHDEEEAEKRKKAQQKRLKKNRELKKRKAVAKKKQAKAEKNATKRKAQLQRRLELVNKKVQEEVESQRAWLQKELNELKQQPSGQDQYANLQQQIDKTKTEIDTMKRMLLESKIMEAKEENQRYQPVSQEEKEYTGKNEQEVRNIYANLEQKNKEQTTFKNLVNALNRTLEPIKRVTGTVATFERYLKNFWLLSLLPLPFPPTKNIAVWYQLWFWGDVAETTRSAVNELMRTRFNVGACNSDKSFYQIQDNNTLNNTLTSTTTQLTPVLASQLLAMDRLGEFIYPGDSPVLPLARSVWQKLRSLPVQEWPQPVGVKRSAVSDLLSSVVVSWRPTPANMVKIRSNLSKGKTIGNHPSVSLFFNLRNVWSSSSDPINNNAIITENVTNSTVYEGKELYSLVERHLLSEIF